jgi:hypothetical protein
MSYRKGSDWRRPWIQNRNPAGDLIVEQTADAVIYSNSEGDRAWHAPPPPPFRYSAGEALGESWI